MTGNAPASIASQAIASTSKLQSPYLLGLPIKEVLSSFIKTVFALVYAVSFGRGSSPTTALGASCFVFSHIIILTC